MGTAADVKVGASGVIYGGPSGTSLPTATSGTPDAAFKDLGDVDETGVKQSIGQNTQDIKKWGGSTVRTVQTSHTVTYQLTLLETNPDALAAYYGSANVDDVLNVVEITSATNQRQSWVIDVLDGTDKIRIVIPDGEVTAHGDVLYKGDTAIGYDITITALSSCGGR